MRPSAPPGRIPLGVIALGLHINTDNERGRHRYGLQQRQPHRSALMSANCRSRAVRAPSRRPRSEATQQTLASRAVFDVAPGEHRTFLPSSTALRTSVAGAGRSAFRPAGCSNDGRQFCRRAVGRKETPPVNIIDVTQAGITRSGKPRPGLCQAYFGASALSDIVLRRCHRYIARSFSKIRRPK